MERHLKDTHVILKHSLLQLFFESIIVLFFYCSVLVCIFEHDVTILYTYLLKQNTQYYSVTATKMIFPFPPPPLRQYYRKYNIEMHMCRPGDEVVIQFSSLC